MPLLLGAAGIDWKVPYFLFVLLLAVGVDYNEFLMSRCAWTYGPSRESSPVAF
jgi:uncharacterized membrane protein YdfJ with MMPL/SSD domain